MQNNREMEAVSIRLYKYLCEEVVGSKSIVRYRRLYYKLHDDILSDNSREVISSGSKAEGLDLPGSDLDMMFCLKSWKVYEDKPKDKEDALLLDTNNALPGFALLKKADSSSFPCYTTKTSDGYLISNEDFVKLLWQDMRQAVPLLEKHGPALTNSWIVDIDLMACFKCHTWPKIANKWLLRFRPSGWPSNDIISQIVFQSCLLVPVGSKSQYSEGNPLEWRFSFSLSEKVLVHSLNHTQLLCYVLLKIWLKEKLNTDNILNNTLCSYFMKTVLFWILEEDENLNWIPQNLLCCFLLCIDRLHYWIACGYFPRYFIPDHNMIDGKLSRADLAYLSLTLDNMNMKINWKIMFSCPSLRNFRNFSISILRNTHFLSDLDKAVLSLQAFGSFMLAAFDQQYTYIICKRIMYMMIRKHLPNSARKILTRMFLKENHNILVSLNIKNHENKQGYLGYKHCLSRNLVNTFYDTEYGWLLLASLFYTTQKYCEMSCILQLSSSIVTLKNSFVPNDVYNQSFRDLTQLRKMVYSGSFVKRMKYETFRVIQIDYNCLRPDNYPFLDAYITDEWLCIHGGRKSYSLFFFLNFLLYRQQGNSLGTQSSLHLLKMMVDEESDKSTNIFFVMSSYILLLKAFELLKNEEEYQTYFLEYLKACKRCDKFEILMKHIDDEEIHNAFEMV